MIRFKAVLILLFVGLLAVCGACREEGTDDRAVRVESYGERKVICVKMPSSPADALLKFEFNDGRNLSAVYWQRNAAFGYLWHLRAEKLFIDVSSNIFFRTPSNFYENLERDINIQKIKNSLTPEILEEFCRQIEKAVLMAPAGLLLEPGLVEDLEKVKQGLRGIDLEPWYRAVEAEKSKIHALGLEYCVDGSQAEKLLSGIDFGLAYRQIVGGRLKNQRRFVVCLGENHPEDADKIEAIRLITELKPLGFNYLLVECVLASDQKILDDYDPNDRTKRKAMSDYLNKSGWANQSLNFGGRGSEPYLELIDAAVRLGFKVVAIAPEQRDDIEFCRYHYDMALNVVNVLKRDPEAKIIVFAGATLAFPNYIPDSDVILEGYLMRQEIPSIVKKLAGVESITFECIGGLKDVEVRKYLNPEKVLEKHVEKRGWQDKRFFIPVPPEISTLSPEAKYYFIHLPQYLNKK